MVAPKTRMSNTNMTAPIGPLDFLTWGGADVATLFLGTGGPLEAGPAPGPTDPATFFGVNGECVTFEADLTPLAPGAPFPMVCGFWMPVPPPGAFVGDPPGADFAGPLEGAAPGGPLEGTFPGGPDLEGAVAFVGGGPPGPAFAGALVGGTPPALLGGGPPNLLGAGALDAALAGGGPPGPFAGIFDAALDGGEPLAGNSLEGALDGIPTVLEGNFLAGAAVLPTGALDGAFAGVFEGALEAALAAPPPAGEDLAGGDFLAKGAAVLDGSLEGRGAPPFAGGVLLGNALEGAPLAGKPAAFFAGSLEGAPPGALVGGPAVFLAGNLEGVPPGIFDGNPAVFFAGSLEGPPPGALEGTPAVFFTGALAGTFPGTLDGGGAPALKGEDSLDGSFLAPAGDGFFKLKAKISLSETGGGSTGDVLMDHVPELFRFNCIEILARGFEVFKCFAQSFSHAVMGFGAPTNNGKILSTGNPFVPVLAVQTNAQEVAFVIGWGTFKLAFHWKSGGVFFQGAGKVSHIYGHNLQSKAQTDHRGRWPKCFHIPPRRINTPVSGGRYGRRSRIPGDPPP